MRGGNRGWVGLLLLGAALGRADTVVLSNSDRLTGEIQKLAEGKLYLKTSYAGVVEIDWGMVESVSSERAYQVEVQNGLRLVGALGPAASGVAVGGEGEKSLVPKGEIVAITERPEERGFLGRVSGNVDLGYSLARGNSRLNQSSLALGAEYRADRYRFQLNILSLFSRQSDAPATSDHMASLRWDYSLGERAFTFTLGSLERDDRQLLNLRTNLGGGLGWKVVRTARTQLSLLGGATYVNEQFRRSPEEGEPRQVSGEGLVGFSLDEAQLGGAKFTTRMSLYPNLVEHGRYRVIFESGTRVPLMGRFSWNLRLFDRFDSRPPIDVQRNDYGVVSGLGVGF